MNTASKSFQNFEKQDVNKKLSALKACPDMRGLVCTIGRPAESQAHQKHQLQRREGLGIPALTLTFIFLLFGLACLAVSADALLNLIGSMIIPECLITAGLVMSLQSRLSQSPGRICYSHLAT